MGYFSNGSEGTIYKEKYCFKCKNWKKGEEAGGWPQGCPIWDLHILYNNPRSPMRALLGHLIPEVKSKSGCPGNGKCKLYVPRSKEVR